VCCDFRSDGYSTVPYAVLLGDEAYRGDYPGACYVGTAVYRPCDFLCRFWGIVECFSIAFRSGFVGRLGSCYLGTGAPEAYRLNCILYLMAIRRHKYFIF